MSYVETMDRPPPDDGLTIEAEIAAETPQMQAELAPMSKLPSGQLFGVMQALWRGDAEHSAEWRRDADFWFGFRAGEQWTEDDKRLLEAQERPHIVFNRVLTILKAVAGMEINGRHEIAYLPRGTEDAEANELLTAASKWMADSCDGEDEESQAFDDCATCGMGWVEERMSYEDDPAGLYIEDHLDPREMYWDRTARKKNLSDARRIWRVRRMAYGDALAMFPGKTREQLDARWAESMLINEPTRSLEQRRVREENLSSLPYDDQCEVIIVHAQWWERETYWIVADAATQSRVELSDAQYRVLEQRMKVLGIPLHAARMTRKVYKQAFLGGDDLLAPAGPAPIKGQFSWKCITGEFDKKKRTFFGLVKVLRDPQMWANKWLSQILHILNSTAKGGLLAETSAFEDQRQAEDSYAHADQITWLADGALSGDKPRVIPKPGQGLTDGYVGLLTFAVTAIRDVSGINLELLGQQDQNQPGIIEAMRKQAGMTVLATLFDSLRRFRKQIGRGRLFFIQNFLSDGRLIRITGTEKAQMVRLVKDKTTGEYDVVVDDTPTSPNQKEANWAIIQPLLVVFKDQLMAQPQILAMLLEYSPLPARIVEAIKGFIEQQQQDPQAAAEREATKQITIAGAWAKIEKDQAAANLANAKAGTAQATAVYDIAMAKNLLEDNIRQGNFDGIKQHLAALEAKAKAEAASADAEVARAKAVREAHGVHADRMDADTRRVEADTNARKANIGLLLEHLSTASAARRNHAAAEKDFAIARREDRTPVGLPAAGS